ncbi:MAG: hypothetical protein ACNA7Z_05055 [Dethiobacteria bacterium]
MEDTFKLYRWYVSTLIINLAMMAVIIGIYAESFSLAMDPFSWLGKITTSGGLANTGAFLFFSLTLFFNIFRWRKALVLLSETGLWKYKQVQILGYMVLAGFFLMAFPCDRFDVIHSTGSGLVIGGLWALSTLALFRLKEEFAPRVFISLQLFLHSAALFCGINFVLDSALKGFSQRPLLIAIIAVSAICLRIKIQIYAEVHYSDEKRQLLFDN